MILSRRIPRILCVTLLIVACGPVPATQNPTNNPSSLPSVLPVANPSLDPTQLSTDIRPGTKGQRLELTGELEIPAGTSSYVILSANAPASTQVALFNLLMAPAWAEDAVGDGDEPISDAQIAELSATVNDEKVTVSVDKIEDQPDGAKLVQYTLKDVPTSEDNAVIVFSSPSGSFKIKGVVPKLIAGLKKLDRFNVETTALSEIILNNPKKPRNLIETEIRNLVKTEAVQKLRDKIIEAFVKPGAQPARFEENLKGPLKEIVDSSPLPDYFDQIDKCRQRGLKCVQRPALPPLKERPIPAALAAIANQRQLVRVKVVQGTHPPTLLERTALLKLGPVNRLRECLLRKVHPCP